MEDRKRHELLWKLARPLVKAATKVLYNYSADIYRGEGPCLVLSNHNSDLDPALIAYSFPEALYFVASEHIMRQGAISDFLRWSTKIIPRQKGGSASSTVRGIIHELQDGHSVCLFPEGNRSWDGLTRPIAPATGKMARMSGAKLITYRTEGVYFSSPRWSGNSVRRGKAHGNIVGVYEPEYLKTLTAKAVQELIETDICEDAYARQKQVRTKFRGRKLAEHLETFLFMCPNCKSENTMESEGNYFYCTKCGAKHRYSAEGFFVGDDVIYDTVLDWSIWQKERIKEKCEVCGDEPIFRDTYMQLYVINSAEKETFVAEGVLTLYRDRLVLPDGTEIPTDKFGGMALLGAQNLFFSSNGVNYLIKSAKIRCTSKYLSACKLFDKNLQYGV